MIDPILASKLDKEDLLWKKQTLLARRKKKVKYKLKAPYSISTEHFDSSGEAEIADFLRKHNILFVQEKEFDTCFNNKTGARFKFDFYLPAFKSVIEFDGAQHFEVNSMNKDQEGLNEIKRKDTRKNNWCSKNGIRMIRIKYIQQKDINKILYSIFGNGRK